MRINRNSLWMWDTVCSHYFPNSFLATLFAFVVLTFNLCTEYFFECSQFPHVALKTSTASKYSNELRFASIAVCLHCDPFTLVCSSVDFKPLLCIL